MNTNQKLVEPTLCPLCGSDNACGNLQPDSGGTCWCANPNLVFPTELLNQVPTAAYGKACICRTCLFKAE